MTISPPYNVKSASGEPVRVLACGIDSLVLAIDVRWLTEATFTKLAELKAAAVGAEGDCPGVLRVSDGTSPWVFTVSPYGRDGYEWILSSGEMSMRIGYWAEPKSRPSVMVELRSETLWTHGPAAAVARVLALLQSAGAEIVEVKVSRVDLCVDVLVPENIWSLQLLNQFVTHAHLEAPYLDRRKLTGFSIGHGKISARLYDKPQEIRSSSHKDWMYGIWGIERVPVGHRVIRVEYQLRREIIKELGFSSFEELQAGLAQVWAYCTQQWLRVADDREKHHTQQTTPAWWTIVQGGMTAGQPACPAIRAKAIKQDEEQMAVQLLGFIASMTALLRQGDMIKSDEILDMPSHLAMVLEVVRRAGWNDAEFTDRVKRKQAKTIRHEAKFAAATIARKAAGVSVRKRSITKERGKR
jgi:hypothetical protein